MKLIPLPLEQKLLLIEMANKLFPEYKQVSVRSQHKGKMVTITQGIEVAGGMISFPYKDMGNVDPYIMRKYMHWLEFTMLELVEKIFNPNPLKCNRNLSNQIKDFYWNINLYWTDSKKYEHPIDYIYKLFKSLDNGK